MSRLFPELEGLAPPAPPPPAPLKARPASTPVPLQTPAPQATPQPRPQESHQQRPPPSAYLVGGVFSMQKFDQLLGLPGPFIAEGGCHVVSAMAFADGHLELEVLGGGIPRTTVCFWGPDADNAYTSTDHFSLGYKGQYAKDALFNLLRRTAQRLQKATLQTLLKVVLMDPEKRIEGLQNNKGPDRESGPDGPGPDGVPGQFRYSKDMLKSLVQVYSSPEAWYNFFADKEQQRNFCHNVSGDIVMIGHEDLECHYATPQINDGTMSFFNYPSVHERYFPDPMDKPSDAPNGERRGDGPRDGKGPGMPGPGPGPNDQDQSRVASPDPTYLISDLHDLDIIKGGAKKLDKVLNSILKYDKKPEMVVVRATCVPIVIGDDMEGSVEKFKKKSGLNVIYLDNIADQHATPFRDTFRRVKDDPSFKNPEKIPGSINLLGFPTHGELGDLLWFLKDRGITLNARMLPDVDLEEMKKYTRADLSVCFDSVLYDQSYREVIGDIDLKAIRPTAPYGMRYSRDWLRTIATEVGRDEQFDVQWQVVEDQVISTRYAAVKKQIAGYRLGFVIDQERALMLTEPRRLMGIPVAQVLQEMGFGLDFFVHVPPGSKTDPKSYLGGLAVENDRVVGFSTPTQLEELIRTSEAQAFYSEVFFDRRLTRTGKGQFSSNMFRMGINGAIETAKKLLAVCRTPYYRKYSSYLGQAFNA